MHCQFCKRHVPVRPGTLTAPVSHVCQSIVTGQPVLAASFDIVAVPPRSATLRVAMHPGLLLLTAEL